MSSLVHEHFTHRIPNEAISKDTSNKDLNKTPKYQGMVYTDNMKGLTKQEWWNKIRIENARILGYDGPTETDDEGNVLIVPILYRR